MCRAVDGHCGGSDLNKLVLLPRNQTQTSLLFPGTCVVPKETGLKITGLKIYKIK